MGKESKKQGGRSKKGRQHVVHETKYRKQYLRTARNKQKAWDKHLELHPKDVKAKENIKKAYKELKTQK